MATITERQPGVYLARVFLPPMAEGEMGRQVGKLFRGGKKAVRAEVAEWEASLRGTAPGTIGATVGDLLELWQQAKAFDWQPTTAVAHRSRANLVAADLGTVRLVDLDPFRIDAWLAKMRRDGVGEGAIRSRVGSLRAALSWGISRRMLRSNPIAEAAPSLKTGRRMARPEPEQVVAIIGATAQEGARAALALRLSAITGARSAEAVALRWERREWSRRRLFGRAALANGDHRSSAWAGGDMPLTGCRAGWIGVSPERCDARWKVRSSICPRRALQGNGKPSGRCGGPSGSPGRRTCQAGD